MTNEQRKEKITALLRERSFAEQKGDADTVTQIDAELRFFGHEAKAPAKRAEKRPSGRASEKRG